jgi:hypothetical protein
MLFLQISQTKKVIKLLFLVLEMAQSLQQKAQQKSL